METNGWFATPGMMTALTISGCRNAATEPSDTLTRTAMVEEVFVEVVSIARTRVELTAAGSFRDSCSDIGDITRSRMANQFHIRIMTTRPADTVCAEVLVPFEELIVLRDTENLAPGDYIVDVNGVREEFTVTLGTGSWTPASTTKE